jgi:hypothetical protein
VKWEGQAPVKMVEVQVTNSISIGDATPPGDGTNRGLNQRRGDGDAGVGRLKAIGLVLAWLPSLARLSFWDLLFLRCAWTL